MSNKTLPYRKAENTKRAFLLTREERIFFGMESPTYLITEGKKTTFGLEIETCIGRLPESYDAILNYSAVHDGSLRGPRGEDPLGGEYVTGVLTGDAGFLQTKKLVDALARNCDIDHRCSVHVHYGNISFNKEYIVYLYKLARDIQGDVFDMLSPSRRGSRYCKLFPDLKIDLNPKNFNCQTSYKLYIDEAYRRIHEYMVYDEHDTISANKKTQHPMGAKCRYNHDTPRYSWINFVPAMFNTRENGCYTIELRPHQGSLNYTKIKNWVKIGMAIMTAPEDLKGYIASNRCTLKDIVAMSFPRTHGDLIEYINERTLKFTTAAKAAKTAKEAELEEYKSIELSDNFSLKSIF
jgi:hypothetical protein